MAGDSSASISGGTVQGFIQENNGIVTQNFITQYAESYIRQAHGAEKLTQKEYRQRTVLLSKVREYWIEGVLEKSLHAQGMIELGLEKRSDAIELPFQGFEKPSEESRKIFPTGTDATEVFNQIGDGRTLLILGEPGAGKTITLLKVAQNLITRAEENVSCLIPVVLNLSSWGTKQQTIVDWLIKELLSKYQVPKKVSKDWLDNQQLVLLMDGLDEVKAERREACVKAINQFTQEHGQTEMLVCSRIADYEVLSNCLQLRGAVYIRSLTPEQVNQYLNKAGKQLEAVKMLLTKDVALQELARSPLMLSVMTLAYQGKRIEELPQLDSVKKHHEHLFDSYIKRMFSHEKIGKSREYIPPYENQKTKAWLTWLAQRMKQESQSLFLIEQMQPNFLPTNIHKGLYRFSSFIFAVITFWSIFYLAALLALPIMKNEIDLTSDFSFYHLGEYVAISMPFALSFGLGDGKIRAVETLEFPWRHPAKLIRKSLFHGLIAFFGTFIVMVLLISVPTFPIHLIHELIDYLGEEDAARLLLDINDEALLRLAFGISFGFGVGLTFAFPLGIVSGVVSSMPGSKISRKAVPNQGIWRALTNTAIIWLITFLTFSTFFLLIEGLASLDLMAGLAVLDRLPMIAIICLIPGLLTTGKALVRHLTLRKILFFSNLIPWNYSKFLDYAAERIFLQKVGGGYIFVHRTLLDYFARMK